MRCTSPWNVPHIADKSAPKTCTWLHHPIDDQENGAPKANAPGHLFEVRTTSNIQGRSSIWAEGEGPAPQHTAVNETLCLRSRSLPETKPSYL